MLDIEFTDVVSLRKPRAGTRKNASETAWDPVLDQDNEPVLIECRISRKQSKNFNAQSVEDTADATLIFKLEAEAQKDITREQLVVDEFGQAYKVLGVSIEREKFGEDVYKRLSLKLTDKVFPPAEVDA